MSSTQQINVAVIIVTYNGEHWVRPCLESVRQSSYPVKTWVIDNNSADKTREIIQSEFPEVILVDSGKNLGFGKANNLGIRAARKEGYETVFLLNQDATMAPDCIEKLVEVHQQHAEYGVLSPLHMNGVGDNLDYKFSTYIKPPRCQDLEQDLNLPESERKSVYTLEFVNAAAWLMTPKCLETVGGFDPLFPHYAEDMDYMTRLNYHGLKAGVHPNTIIQHYREGRDKPYDPKDLKRAKTLLFLQALTRLKDVRHSFFRLFLREVIRLKWAAFSSLLRFNWRAVYISGYALLRITRKMPAIARHHRLSRQKGLTFLTD